MHKILLVLAMLGCACVLPGQTSSIVSGGYTFPVPIAAAPGQLLTLFVDDAGINISGPVRAPGGTLPTTLAGIAVTFRQGSDLPAPILEVRPVSTCPGLVMAAVVGQPTCATLAAVTVQIPYELLPLCPLCARPSDPPAVLLVTVNGKGGNLTLLNPLADQIHVLSSCDVMLQPATPPPPNITGLPCPPMVTHSNGAMVSPSNPAIVGEELVAWAVGLGQTNPPAATGKPATASAPVAQNLTIGYNYTPNALPAKPFGLRVPSPLYAGLAAGFVGLYQINFVVPQDPPNGTPRCALTGTFAVGTNVVQSNLTVSFGGGYSFDGAGICVSTRIPVD